MNDPFQLPPPAVVEFPPLVPGKCNPPHPTLKKFRERPCLGCGRSCEYICSPCDQILADNSHFFCVCGAAQMFDRDVFRWMTRDEFSKHPGVADWDKIKMPIAIYTLEGEMRVQLFSPFSAPKPFSCDGVPILETPIRIEIFDTCPIDLPSAQVPRRQGQAAAFRSAMRKAWLAGAGFLVGWIVRSIVGISQ